MPRDETFSTKNELVVLWAQLKPYHYSGKSSGLVNPHDSTSALGLDLAAFIGQDESLQCFSCFCDTHLLRSVIKLFKLGRLDKLRLTCRRLYQNNSVQPF